MKDDEAGAIVTAILTDAAKVHEAVSRLDPAPVIAAAAAMTASLRSGGRVLIFGNGGSAADAQHAAAELVGRFEQERRAMAAVALTTDASVLTSVANDYGFERVFARQIEALGRPGDVAFAITTSGQSRNVVGALRVARERGLRTIALTGRDGGEAGREAEVHVNVASASTARVQEAHRTLLHAICALVEKAMADA